MPTYRPDLTRPADLVEEIARLADFDTFDETVPTGPAGGLLIEQKHTRLVHNILRGIGLIQAINLPFVAEAELAVFNGQVTDDGTPEVVSVRNPLREDQANLRQSLLPGLLRNVRENRNRGIESVALFESGRVFFARPWADDARVPEQPVRLAVVVVGPFGSDRIGNRTPNADAATALGIVETIGDGLGVTIERQQATTAGLHPTRTARLVVDGNPIGFAGELHPDVSDMFELDERVAVVELDLTPLVGDRPSVQMASVSNYPHVDFDLSFEVEMDASAGDLLGATGAVSSLLEFGRIFDDYRSDRGERAVAIRYRLRAPDRTLDADEIAAVRDKMIKAAASEGARLRGGV